jgi:hypothetical protein
MFLISMRESGAPGSWSLTVYGSVVPSTKQNGLAASTKLTSTGVGGVSLDVCDRIVSMGRPLGRSLPVIAPDGFQKVISTRNPVEERPGNTQSPYSRKWPSSSRHDTRRPKWQITKDGQLFTHNRQSIVTHAGCGQVHVAKRLSRQLPRHQEAVQSLCTSLHTRHIPAKTIVSLKDSPCLSIYEFTHTGTSYSVVEIYRIAVPYLHGSSSTSRLIRA